MRVIYRCPDGHETRLWLTGIDPRTVEVRCTARLERGLCWKRARFESYDCEKEA